MPVFRIEKTNNYTIMSNIHMKDKSLSLKAKGLLTQMLSLPEDWDYTLKGLAYLNKDGLDAIREAVRELEKAGYVVRSRVRNEKGQLAGTEYVIYEKPQKPVSAPPVLAEPMQENPTQDKPVQENPTQLNTKKSKTNESITYESNPYPINPADAQSKSDGYDGMGYEEAKEIVKENIDYNVLVTHPDQDQERLDAVVDLIAEVLCSRKDTMVISGGEYPIGMVQDRLLKIDGMHIEYVFECMDKTPTYIRNIKKYLLAALYNAPLTMGPYYAALVNHDMNGDGLRGK